MVVRRLDGELRQIAVASSGYLEGYGTAVRPSELRDHRCINWRWRGHAHPDCWEFHQDGAWFSVAVDGKSL